MTVIANAKLKFKHNEAVNHVQNGNCSRSDLSQIRSVTNQYLLHLHYQIRIWWLGSFNIRRMSNAVKLCKIWQRSNSNFVTSLVMILLMFYIWCLVFVGSVFRCIKTETDKLLLVSGSSDLTVMVHVIKKIPNSFYTVVKGMQFKLNRREWWRRCSQTHGR